MDDFVKSSALSMSGGVTSFLPMLYFLLIVLQFGPGHVRVSIAGRLRTSTWQHWGVYSLALLFASWGATIVLLQFAGYDFKYMETLMFCDLGAGFAASVIVLLNVVLMSPRCYPNHAFQTVLLIFALLSLGAAAWVGVASGLAHEVLVYSASGIILGLIVSYPLYLTQRFGGGAANES
jgi:hypothetical protein